MKVFVTGANGQVGHDVMKELAARNYQRIGSGTGKAVFDTTGAVYIPLDIRDEAAVIRVIAENRPDAVVHCASWTAVDAAELTENQKTVYDVNVQGTTYLARACAAIGCKLIYLSTDYVFDGSGSTPWIPDTERFAPLNVYGKSKLEGELAIKRLMEKHFIVRISWVFGKNGRNFVQTMLNLGQTCKNIRVVNDQVGTPTYTRDIAKLLVDMLETEKYGVYHATNEGGYISWATFAREIFRQTGMNTDVIPVTTAQYGLSTAIRPLNSRLDKHKLAENGFHLLPIWQNALARYLKEIEHESQF